MRTIKAISFRFWTCRRKNEWSIEYNEPPPAPAEPTIVEYRLRPPNPLGRTETEASARLDVAKHLAFRTALDETLEDWSITPIKCITLAEWLGGASLFAKG